MQVARYPNIHEINQNKITQAVDAEVIEGVDNHRVGKVISAAPEFGMLAKGVVTGVAVSTIVQTGRSIMGLLVKHPLVIFGLGVATGYLTHKYRKELVSSVASAAEQSRDFVLRQKGNIADIPAETHERTP